MLLIAEWSTWSEAPCSKRCGGGRIVRRRTCVKSPPCPGSDTRIDVCNTHACEGTKLKILKTL